MKKKPAIDTIKMVRKIRDKQSKKYYLNTEKLLNDLKQFDDQKRKTSQSPA